MDAKTESSVSAGISWGLLVLNAAALVVGWMVFSWCRREFSTPGEHWGIVLLIPYGIAAMLVLTVLLIGTVASLGTPRVMPWWCKGFSLAVVLGAIVLNIAAMGYVFGHSVERQAAATRNNALYSSGLRDAVLAGDAPRADAILAADRDGLWQTDIEGNTALQLAVRQGDEPMVEVLLRRGADPNQGHWEGTRPLHVAADADAAGIITRLLNAGARINDEDEAGKTALARAKAAGSARAVALLSARGGMDIDETKRAIDAVRAGNIATVKAFLDGGLAVDAAPTDGHSLLDYAAEEGDVPMAEFLILRGASVKRTDAYGRTPLHWASSACKPATTEYLLTQGAAANAVEHEGKTPLHYAIGKVQFHEVEGLATVKALVKGGADLTIKCKSGETPVEWAATYGTADVKAFLAGK